MDHVERESVMRDIAASIARDRREAQEWAEDRDEKSYKKSLKKVKPGDTKAEVLRKLGQPELRETLGPVLYGYGPEKEIWTYIRPSGDTVVTFRHRKVNSID